MLSKRLQMAADMVTSGYRFADVGTDHGYIPIYLTGEGRIPFALAMDVRTGPLGIATSHIREEGLEDKIETRLSDGVGALKQEDAIESVMITGMGGPLIVRILEQGAEKLSEVKELILSPQSDWPLVRTYLEEHRYKIDREAMVEEDGKYYVILHVVSGEMGPLPEVEKQYGPVLLHNKDGVLLEYLNHLLQVKDGVLQQLSLQSGEKAKKRYEEIRQECDCIREALAYYNR